MADRSISELTAVTTVNSDDAFVLQQNNRAMRLTGQTLLNWLATALDGHGGINNIAKTGTSGNVDTYTITFADETTDTFNVKNGKEITGISKTGTQALVDTYAIAYNDGTSDSFSVTNGRGITNIAKTSSGLTDTYVISYSDGTSYSMEVDNGRSISSITKTGQNVLVDTYTITYNDDTTHNFSVTNGRGIVRIDKQTTVLTDTYRIVYNDDTDYEMEISNGRSIESVVKTETIGLVDTYTITYNDLTTSTFEVTNGEKGDKGDTGEKGDKGDNITITGATIEYAASASGTIPPSSWQSSIPTVSPGNFLWTKTYVLYSDGVDTTSYSVSRYGLDGGGGTVNTVHGVPADSNGNVDFIRVVNTTLTIGAQST